MNKVRKLIIYQAIKCHGDQKTLVDKIIKKELLEDDKIVDEALAKLKCKALTIIDEDYPEYLRHITKPPIVLFYYGDISLISDYNKNISVIGSRENTSYGAVMTETIVKDLVPSYNIVSGLAAGIDGLSHLAAIKNKGKTIAVLGSGIEYCYPYINKDIYDIIKKEHLLISEYPFYCCEPQNFPERNRLIAAFSKALLVIEAKERSGTFITVMHALNMGKDVMCVPNVANVESGCNKLIKEGAYLVENANDVLDVIK